MAATLSPMMEENEYILACHLRAYLKHFPLDKTRKSYLKLAHELARGWEATKGHVRLKTTTRARLWCAVLIYGRSFDPAVDPLVRKRALYCIHMLYTHHRRLYFQLLKKLGVMPANVESLLPIEPEVREVGRG